MVIANKLSDNDLLAQVKLGDKAAFTEIYDRYNGLLYLFALKRIHDREEAKDLIHELFLKLWTDHQLINDTINLRAYLYTSLKNRIINSFTRQRVESRYIDSFQHYLDTVDSGTTDHLVRHNDLLAFIESEIANLHPRTRLVFELSRKTNLSRKEIAQKLDISEETVKSHMHNALKILKVKLGPLFFLLF
ncbi:RNA polymerase sigma factor [Mucilaginibacter sp. SG564]|uniref:RNA polymerase sigma factor n=1 Tax=Mucilaginibacter sp. SG564 TaxID=2587022 RepID=UPI001556BB25|nr:RNA polymerase sigma-70 factor [Mucilaginibacter sp. SG564]NOW94989.1 RNA polymerase sigma-70 factor (ECF subfamily) [Mucilaginibacter sp. SG564]